MTSFSSSATTTTYLLPPSPSTKVTIDVRKLIDRKTRLKATGDDILNISDSSLSGTTEGDGRHLTCLFDCRLPDPQRSIIPSCPLLLVDNLRSPIFPGIRPSCCNFRDHRQSKQKYPADHVKVAKPALLRTHHNLRRTESQELQGMIHFPPKPNKLTLSPLPFRPQSLSPSIPPQPSSPAPPS
ncbi:hypothetical protein CGRA01v4_11384 [Colletotrichum graminicola]|nr:hypothetical protein CGRA01v4_11384 [Colletotrichum graminicola]